VKSLSRRLLTTLLAAGLVLLVVGILALYAFLAMRADQRTVTREFYDSIQDSNRGFVTVIELSESGSSYLESGDPEDLARFQELLQPREDASTPEEQQARLVDAPEALREYREVRSQALAWFSRLQELVARAQAGGPQTVSTGDRAALRTAFLDLRQGYEEYIRAVTDARAVAVDRLAERTSLLFATVLAAIAAAVAAGLALYAALRTWVTTPLARLGEETRTVRSGELDHEVVVDGPPEIVALGADVEAMRRGLVEQLAEVRRAQRLLEQQADDLRRSNRDLEQFAYVASHDLQEPLRKVSSFCQMLERRYKGQLDERADQYIEFAVDGAKRMQLLINDLLAFSRVGRMSDGFVEVAMDGVLADALRNLSAAVEESGAVVTADPLPVVHGERRLLVQLLQNLIGNGIKFRGAEPPRLHVGARREGECWELSVSDNGIGIEPQYAERIFVIFQRLHPKADYDGTGIGLALCKKIVEHHAGAIWLDTDAGSGTVFRWTMPVEAPVRLPHQEEAPVGAKETAWLTT
jgi:signal transduction histidine kinase